MARQQGNNYIIGTINHIVYYQLRGGYYLRTKSRLDRTRFQKDPAFANSRGRAAQFGEAVKLAKEIYYLLPKEGRQRGFMGILSGLVHKKLLTGQTKEAVREEVLALYGVEPLDRKQEGKQRSCLTKLSSGVLSTGQSSKEPDPAAMLHYQKGCTTIIGFTALPDG